MRLLVVVAALVVTATSSCAPADGCTKDTDCRAPRVCEASVCVDPDGDGGQCLAQGEECEDDDACCSGLRCAGTCAPCPGIGALCSIDSDCCGELACYEQRCVDFDTCRSLNEACDVDVDCCGGTCTESICRLSPDDCHVPDQGCTSDASCCAGACDQGAADFPRCE